MLPHVGRLPLLVAWSLVYEIYFYVVFAIALLLGRRRFPWVMAVWVAITLTLSVMASDVTNPYVVIVASPLSLEFVLGVVIGLATVHGRFVRPNVVLALGVVSFCSCLVLLALSGWSHFPSDGVRVALVAIPAGLVVYGAIGVEMRYGRIVPPSMRRLGDASYSLYLAHVPALALLALVLAGRLPTTPLVHALTLPAVLVYVVCAALVCYALLERPLLNTSGTTPAPDAAIGGPTCGHDLRAHGTTALSPTLAPDGSRSTTSPGARTGLAVAPPPGRDPDGTGRCTPTLEDAVLAELQRRGMDISIVGIPDLATRRHRAGPPRRHHRPGR